MTAALALVAWASACSDGGTDESSAGSTGASATTTGGTGGGETEATEASASTGTSDVSASASTTTTTTTASTDATTTSTSMTTSTTDATSIATEDVTSGVTTGPRACASIVGSMECEALAEVSIDLTLEECLLCQGAPCGREALCDGQYPCVDGVIVLRGCCQDLECEGLTPFCGMYLGTNDICVLSDDI